MRTSEPRELCRDVMLELGEALYFCYFGMSLFVALWLGKVYNGGQDIAFPLNDTLGGLSAWESWSSGRFGVFWSGDNDIGGNWGGRTE